MLDRSDGKRNRSDGSSSDSSDSSVSNPQKKGRLIQAALVALNDPPDPTNVKLPDSPELISNDPTDPDTKTNY